MTPDQAAVLAEAAQAEQERRIESGQPKHMLATDLAVGDDLVNLGTVTDVMRHGVFVLTQVATVEWSIVTGRGTDSHRLLVLHEADSVVIA